MNYEVYFETTPNPASMKFIVNATICEEPLDFADAQEADAAPLASKLFGFPWTARVFIGTNFVTVTKQDWVDWETLAEPLAGLIREHLERGEPVIHPREALMFDENDSEQVKIIKRIINQEVRPAVAMDGGDIIFHKYENNIVYLYMKGSCSGCPSSTMTLKMGIESRLREALPEIIEVVSM